MTKIPGEGVNKTKSLQDDAQKIQGNSPSPPKPTRIDMADLANWAMKYALVPLIPFLIGALIRWLENGIGWNAFKPVQLTFALAMFCLLVYASAERLDRLQYKETIQSIYVLGMVLFIALFTYATVKDSQLSELHNRTRDKLIEAAEAQGCVSKETVNQHAQEDVIDNINNTNTLVVGISGFFGVVFILFGVGLRHWYRIGD
ncbi:MAG: hypothetical protein ACPGWR_10125 [Ardenticatenaceae bacterium]